MIATTFDLLFKTSYSTSKYTLNRVPTSVLIIQSITRYSLTTCILPHIDADLLSIYDTYVTRVVNDYYRNNNEIPVNSCRPVEVNTEQFSKLFYIYLINTKHPNNNGN